MKYLVAVLLSWTGAQAAPPPQVPPPRPSIGLRQALEQYHPGTSTAPRQLSPDERAQLRRQLQEFGQEFGQPANPFAQRSPYEQVPATHRR